jgi:hypothetical protein
MCPVPIEVNTPSSERSARRNLRRHVVTTNRRFVSISLVNRQAI